LREFLLQYGNKWTVWGAGTSHVALLVLLTVAAADVSGDLFWRSGPHSAVFFLSSFCSME
jgi:hypothetical protein